MADDNPKRKQVIDEFSLIMGVLLAVFAQAAYDSLKQYYEINYPVLGPYFPSAWAGLVIGLVIMGIYGIRLRWRRLFTVSDGT